MLKELEFASNSNKIAKITNPDTVAHQEAKSEARKDSEVAATIPFQVCEFIDCALTKSLGCNRGCG